MSEVNKYSNAYIYTIRCRTDDSLIYVGSTISSIHKRLSAHKNNCKNGKPGSLYNYIIDNDWSDWYVELYERYPCNNRDELCKREGEVIREIGTINKYVAGRKQKEYYMDNHDKELARMKEYRVNNPDYMKEWREKNPDYMKEYNKEYYARKRSATP